MNCSYCKKPIKHAIVLMENVPGVGPERKDACFSCVSRVAESEMRMSQKAICPTCNTESEKVTLKADSNFEFSCKSGHTWVL